MFIRDLYSRQPVTISFEFFPPKTAEAEATLFRETVPGLQQLHPGYISVTYGAGGGTRESTLRIVSRLRTEFGIESLFHFTCVGSSRDTLAGILDQTQNLGIENILALRGDPPKGQTTFTPEPGGFAHAVELIAFIKKRWPFCLGAACYPEGHVECQDRKLDWDRAAAKVEAGADFLITQLFYDVRHFLEMEDYLRNQRHVKVPIIPGILPFLSAEQINRFTSLCGAQLPQPLQQRLAELASDNEAVRQLGVEVCTDLCQKLISHGVKGFHFYCLNRVPSTRAILHNLGLAPAEKEGNGALPAGTTTPLAGRPRSI